MSEIKVTFNRNVKFNTECYKKGESTNVSIAECKSLLESNVIAPVDESLLIGPDPVDLYTLSKEELAKVKKDEIVEFLKNEGIDHDPKATKEELIELIAGE